MNIEIPMRYKKSTKNTFVFEEIDDAADIPIDSVVSIPTLYIRKHCFAEERTPMHITVKVSSE